MCLLCNDEKAYQAYMNYLDAMERQGKAADPDKAIDVVLDQLEAQAKTEAKTRVKQDDPANDKTLSPFFCSPINK
jgi:ribosome-associated translation inhibitor RaiA